MSSAAHAEPFTPSDDAVILERLPDGTDPTARILRAQHAKLARDPTNLKLAVSVAQADIDRARSAADPRWLGRAEAAMAPWSQDDATPNEITLLRATVLQSNHDFVTSRRLLEHLLARQPANGQAWLTLASINQVQAQHAETIYDCGRLAMLVLGLAPDTCTAGVMAMQGHAPLALRALDVSLKVNAAEPVPVREWSATLAAQIAERLGDPSAGARYHSTLALQPDDPYLLGAYSDFLLDHGRAAEVVKLLADKTRIDPLLLRLALAEQSLKHGDLTKHISDLAQRFAAAHARGDTVHRREEAMFELYLRHDPRKALTLASANWDVQRETADARILLEAALAASEPRAAEPVRQWMRQTHIQDTKLSALDAQLQSRS